MKTGDLEPPWTVDIGDALAAGDLNDVDSWRFVGSLNGTVVFTDTAPTVTVDPGAASSATIEHEWVDGETETPGLMDGEIIATWPGGREQTFPGLGRMSIRIEPGLD